jgi:NodT family efflux transporter outer membrane factor (OMF) lipoprotein
MNVRKAYSLILLVLPILSGCLSIGPDYRAPVPEAPAAWSRLEGPADNATAPDLGRWWHNLGDPLLSDIVRQALDANLDLRNAQARLREARARRAVALAGFFPAVDASGSRSRSQSSRETGSGMTRELYSGSLDASWELDVFGGTRRGFEAAEADFESSLAELHAAQVTVAAEAALSYVEMRALQERLRIARDNLASQTETLQLTQWRAQAGLVDSQDVAQARSNREQTLAQVPALETSLAETQHSLESRARAAHGPVVVLYNNNHPQSGGHTTCSPDVLVSGPNASGRHPGRHIAPAPDIRAAERALAAETARVGVAEAARYPSFNISGSIGLEALTFRALGGGDAGTSSLLAGITVPIFEAGRLKNQVEIQDAVREQALVAYEKAVLTALQEVENALVSLTRSRERAQALGDATDAARNAADMARLRYASGLIDFQSVLDTERSVRTIEDSLASARADGVLALIRLYKAMGGGWSPQTGTAPTRKDTP